MRGTRNPGPSITPSIAMLAIATFAHAACGAADADPDVVSTVRDSAGVRIVEHSGVPPEIQLGDPVLRIGSLDGPEHDQLHRVQGAARLGDGRIVIADGGSSQLRFFDATGAHLMNFGRRGGGPGEFQSMSFMRRLRGDSILVFDSRLRRVTVVSPDGAVAREVPLTLEGRGSLAVAAATIDGTLLLRRMAAMSTESRDYLRDTLDLSIHRDGAAPVNMPPYLGSEMQRRVEENGQMVMIMLSTLPFARTSHTAAGTAFWIGSTDMYEIHGYDTTGRLAIILRSAHVPQRSVDDALLARFADARVEDRRRALQSGSGEFDERAIRRDLDALPRVSGLPFYDGLFADDAGRLWVREFDVPDIDPLPSRWAVFDADGAFLSMVVMPPRTRPLAGDDTMLLALVQDEFDVEYVHGYRLPW